MWLMDFKSPDFKAIAITTYQFFFNPDHPGLPLNFLLSNIFLLLFLFPTLYTLSSLLATYGGNAP